MAKWSLDKAHSELEFKVKHMMISNVKGQFQDFDVTIDGDSADLSETTVSVEIRTDSVTTKNEPRDQHLRSEEFFNAAAYPLITFTSTEIKKVDNDEYKLSGDLTVKGVTKPATFTAEFGGIAKDPWGNQKAGYTVHGKINRQDFGLTWNAALETGGVMVSEEVKFHAEVQFVLS
ncbi:polyisoprenoid-binding protein YceI [Sphingobacterium allocomposti]|jgi:polyisoprenoid-binding protein YceI|uniref:Polyisoprenoid-binding protein YceI n=1 Tax=Sphingobacterium allocomposti TaxID=415956 RepID=A0A5S5DM26_9SPHI|nr:YceI family protein [Sphingobacterium composti Yoo et al. 2007 non Ten et al. 2007]TYP96987.1 polyisoprenoid-binding protein YceI [Sphingobacterium composti Yoo et al. 2007 non Ten et al. 2007]HLS94284.1 YceI family protein [Sphingobacterium sp.]